MTARVVRAWAPLNLGRDWIRWAAPIRIDFPDRWWDESMRRAALGIRVPAPGRLDCWSASACPIKDIRDQTLPVIAAQKWTAGSLHLFNYSAGIPHHAGSMFSYQITTGPLPQELPYMTRFVWGRTGQLERNGSTLTGQDYAPLPFYFEVCGPGQ